MKILDLINQKASSVKYEISRFPDGQQQVKIIDLGYVFEGECEFQIKSRLNNFRDLELIICAIASLRSLDVKSIHLYVPYFLGSRSDRKFENGGNNYLKDVICPIVNSLKLDSVTVLDPHSDVLEACLKGFKKKSNLRLILWALHEHIYPGDGLVNSKTIFVSPDSGATKKIYKIADEIKFTGEILTCSKERDTNGNLNKTIVPFFDLTKDVVIIDDICDGGATFINIAKEIKDRNYTGKLYLIVTHGIFSKGFGELQQYFDKIYCTNSYQDLMPDTQSFVKQFNVF